MQTIDEAASAFLANRVGGIALFFGQRGATRRVRNHEQE